MVVCVPGLFGRLAGALAGLYELLPRTEEDGFGFALETLVL